MPGTGNTPGRRRAPAGGATRGLHSLSRPRLTVAGFPVAVHPSFFATAIMLSGALQLSYLVWWVAIVFGSVLAHELGHAAAFRLFGIPSEIHLHGLGGVTTPTGPGRLTAPRRIVVSLAGPLTGLAIGAVALALWRSAAPEPGTLGYQVGADIMLANVVWSLANLLPILPLDGGQVMAGVVSGLARRHADTITQVISMATAAVVAVWALSRGLALTAVMVVAFWAMSAAAFWRGRAATADEPLRGELEAGWASLRMGDVRLSETRARELLGRARSRAVRQGAAQLLAMSGVLGARADVAAEGLRRLPRGVHPDPRLSGLVALVSGRPAEAVRDLTEAFAADPGDPAGAPLVQALVRAGQPEDAISLVTGPQAERVGLPTHQALVGSLHDAGRAREAGERAEAALAHWPDRRLAAAGAAAWEAAGEPERARRCVALAASVVAGDAGGAGAGSDAHLDVEEHDRPEDHGEDR